MQPSVSALLIEEPLELNMELTFLGGGAANAYELSSTHFRRLLFSNSP